MSDLLEAALRKIATGDTLVFDEAENRHVEVAMDAEEMSELARNVLASASPETQTGTGTASAAAVLALEAEAANQCEGPMVGDERGHFYCAKLFGISEILDERLRQVETHGELGPKDALALAASCYASRASDDTRKYDRPILWPWERERWVPGPAREMLVKAAALILLEIERLDRAGPSKPGCAGSRS